MANNSMKQISHKTNHHEGREETKRLTLLGRVNETQRKLPYAQIIPRE
jgi:hypothetical protein